MATFSDVNSNFGLVTLPEVVVDIQAINNSLYNILATPIGSRTFQPEYGSVLHKFIHEPVDAQTAIAIEMLLVQAIERWEPRIAIDRSRTRAIPKHLGFEVELYYSIPRINKVSNVNFSFTG